MPAENDSKVTLSYPGGEFAMSIAQATEGADGIELGKLLASTGYTTLDQGFVNTASTRSSITYIDGDAGILRYRGYPIDQLASQSTFTEVAYLLIYGELPTADQLGDFEERISRHTMLHEDLKAFFQGFPRDAHPMPVLSSAVSALGTFYQDSLDPFDERQVEISTIRLLAKLPTIAAYAYKKSVGQPFLYPDNSLSYTGNFLRMTFGVPAEPYEVNPIVEKAMDRIFILHADHEQNASTSTVRTNVVIPLDKLSAVVQGDKDATVTMTNGAQISGAELAQRAMAEEGFITLIHPVEGPVNLYRMRRGATWKQFMMAAAENPVCPVRGCHRPAD